MALARIEARLTIEPVAEFEGEKLPRGAVFTTQFYANENSFPFMEDELELILDRFYKGVKREWTTGAGEQFEKDWMSKSE